jgi:hypothetical protein
MNKIIRRFFPVERLPAELQSGLPKHGRVHIELEPDVEPLEACPVAPLIGSGRNVHGDEDAVLNHIRSLRDDR